MIAGARSGVQPVAAPICPASNGSFIDEHPH
jgi:hypothetical protein